MMVKPIGISELPRGPHFQVPCLFWGVYLFGGSKPRIFADGGNQPTRGDASNHSCETFGSQGPSLRRISTPAFGGGEFMGENSREGRILL